MTFLVWYIGFFILCIAAGWFRGQSVALEVFCLVSCGVWILAGGVIVLYRVLNLPAVVKRMAREQSNRGGERGKATEEAQAE